MVEMAGDDDASVAAEGSAREVADEVSEDLGRRPVTGRRDDVGYHGARSDGSRLTSVDPFSPFRAQIQFCERHGDFVLNGEPGIGEDPMAALELKGDRFVVLAESLILGESGEGRVHAIPEGEGKDRRRFRMQDRGRGRLFDGLENVEQSADRFPSAGRNLKSRIGTATLDLVA